MMKKLGLTSIIASALLFTGCGGGGGGSDEPVNPLVEKNYIVILTEVQAGICESTEFRTELSRLGFENFITEETDNTSSCATYGKENNDIECTMELVGGGDRNCAVGFDEFPPGIDRLATQFEQGEFLEIAEVVSSTF